MNVTQSLMPMANAAAERALPPNTADLMPPMPPPAPVPVQGPPPPAAPQMSLPPGIEMPPPAQPAGNTMQQPPQPTVQINPPPVPFDAMVQQDGSIAAKLKGTDIFLQRYEPPKIPPALQPPKPKKTAQPTQ